MMSMKNPTTGERLVKIETEIQEVKKNNKEQFEMIKSISLKLDELDSKFAGKWVEKISISLLIIAIGSLITLLARGL